MKTIIAVPWMLILYLGIRITGILIKIVHWIYVFANEDIVNWIDARMKQVTAWVEK